MCFFCFVFVFCFVLLLFVVVVFCCCCCFCLFVPAKCNIIKDFGWLFYLFFRLRSQPEDWKEGGYMRKEGNPNHGSSKQSPEAKNKTHQQQLADGLWVAEINLYGNSLKQKTAKKVRSSPAGVMWKRAEKSAPILGELREGATLHQHNKLGDREDSFVQQEWKNLRHSHWKCEEGKIMNMNTLENYNIKRPGGKHNNKLYACLTRPMTLCRSQIVDTFHSPFLFFQRGYHEVRLKPKG